MDGKTKNALWEFWIKGGDEEVLLDDIVSSDGEWKEYDNTNHLNHNSNPFFKPYFDAQEVNNVYCDLGFLEIIAQTNFTFILPRHRHSCALVKKYLTSEFAEALTPVEPAHNRGLLCLLDCRIPFLLKTPVSDALDRTDVIFAFLSTTQRWKLILQGQSLGNESFELGYGKAVFRFLCHLSEGLTKSTLIVSFLWHSLSDIEERRLVVSRSSPFWKSAFLNQVSGRSLGSEESYRCFVLPGSGECALHPAVMSLGLKVAIWARLSSSCYLPWFDPAEGPSSSSSSSSSSQSCFLLWSSNLDCKLHYQWHLHLLIKASIRAWSLILVWYSWGHGLGSGPAQGEHSCAFSETDTGMLALDVTMLMKDSRITFSEVSSSVLFFFDRSIRNESIVLRLLNGLSLANTYGVLGVVSVYWIPVRLLLQHGDMTLWQKKAGSKLRLIARSIVSIITSPSPFIDRFQTHPLSLIEFRIIPPSS
ncbi:hypothetical protein Tco_0858573 [Tanacetum coccineum]|uniref:Uncharacterized protein n=1 Tax=Tanacetum coccineum TaxID=301880 RepID=A0ABQ5BA88_9ASTR